MSRLDFCSETCNMPAARKFSTERPNNMSYPVIDMANIYEARLVRRRDNNDDMINVLHFRDEDGMGLSDAADKLRDAFVNLAASGTDYDDYIGMVSNNVGFHRWDVRSLDGPDYPVTSRTFDSDFNGEGTAFSLPGQNAVVVTLQTGLARRRGRGRIYDGGFTTALLNSQGRIVSGAPGQIQAFWRGLFMACLTGSAPGMRLGVLSRGWIDDDPLRPRPGFAAAFRPLLGPDQLIVRDDQVDTQRRRQGSD